MDQVRSLPKSRCPYCCMADSDVTGLRSSNTTLELCLYFRICLYSLSLKDVENYSVYLNSHNLILLSLSKQLFNRLKIKENYNHQVGQKSVLSSLKLMYSIFQKTHERNSNIMYSDHNKNIVVLNRKQNAVKCCVFNQEIFHGYCTDTLSMF